jgi:hypothetical protein
VKVAIDQASGRMTWTGGMPMGMFTGERTFTVTPTDGGCHFKMREEYTGRMLRFIWKSIPTSAHLSSSSPTASRPPPRRKNPRRTRLTAPWKRGGPPGDQ